MLEGTWPLAGWGPRVPAEGKNSILRRKCGRAGMDKRDTKRQKAIEAFTAGDRRMKWRGVVKALEGGGYAHG